MRNDGNMRCAQEQMSSGSIPGPAAALLPAADSYHLLSSHLSDEKRLVSGV